MPADHVMHASYEWVIETCTADEYEDIEDLHHTTKLSDWSDETIRDAIRKKSYDCEQFKQRMFTRLALIRNWGCQDEGIVDRVYAYVNEDGELPEAFDEGQKIPDRFRSQLAKAKEAAFRDA